MRFDTATFWLFFAVAWTAWRYLPFAAAKGATLVLSLLFYAWWNPSYLSLIGLSTAVDFVAGKRIHASEVPERRRRWLVASLATNLGLLAFFKYTPFAIENVAGIGSWLGWNPSGWDLPDWVVPVGISFYTFQTLSYTIDIYRRRLVPTESFIEFFLYVSFFPQLVAGPIVRAKELLPQLRARRPLLPAAVQQGAYLCIWGLFMKVVVADNLAPKVERVYSMGALPHLSPTEVWLGVTYFSCQAFADFAGYSAIAIGLAYLMGLRFPVNFNYPFLARGPIEFWRRWHMTLSHWLRDYLYIPLGGSRRGTLRTYVNLLITMVLCGLWHGAAWGYVAFGVLQGAGVCIERMLRGAGRNTERDPPPSGPGEALRRLGEIAFAFAFLEFTFVFFRSTSFDMTRLMLERMFVAPFTEGLGLGSLSEARHLILCLPVLAVHMGQLLREWWGLRSSPRVQALGCSVMLFLLLVITRKNGDAFIYFQF